MAKRTKPIVEVAQDEDGRWVVSVIFSSQAEDEAWRYANEVRGTSLFTLEPLKVVPMEPRGDGKT